MVALAGNSIFSNISIPNLKQDISLSQLLIHAAGLGCHILVSCEHSHQLDQPTASSRYCLQIQATTSAALP